MTINTIYKGFAGAALLCLGGLTAMAQEFAIPATQQEFDTWVQVVPDGAQPWTLVTDNGPEPYASVVTCITDYNSKDLGQILLVPKTYELKAGDEVNIAAMMSACDDAGFYRFSFVGVSTDSSIAPVASTRMSVYGSNEGLSWTNKSGSFKVQTDGTYRVGVAVQGQRDFTTNPPTMFFKSITIARTLDAPAPVKWASLNPAKADPNGTRSVTLSFTWPSTTKKGNALSSVRGIIYRGTEMSFKDAKEIADIAGTPGESATYVDCAENNPETAITEDGQYYYWIVPYYKEGEDTAKGDEPMLCAIVPWVGYDAMTKPLDASKASLERIDNGFNVNFLKEFKGVNGGNVDLSQCTIKVTRQRGVEAPVVLTADYTGESPYVDNTIQQNGSYLYRLYVVYKGQETDPCVVGPAYYGEGLTVPYEQTFNSVEDTGDYSVVSDGSYFWGYNAEQACLEFAASEYIESKASIMTPAIKMVGGTEYKISCNAWVDETEGQPVARPLSLTAGNAPQFDAQANFKALTVTGTQAAKGTYEGNYTPEEDGDVFIGFQTQFRGLDKVYVDNVKIIEVSRIPAKVTDITVTPKAGDYTTAVVEFTLPSTSTGGSKLDNNNISQVLVYRYTEKDGASVVTLPENIDKTPGAKVRVEDKVPAEDYYNYMVYTMNGSDLSPMAESGNVWVGKPTGVDGIVTDSAEAVYYTVGGVRVENPTVPGIYIKKQGNKATRVLVK